MRTTNETSSAVDQAVASFTHQLLETARKNDVNFKYVGPKGSKPDEVLAVLRENYKTAKKLLGK